MGMNTQTQEALKLALEALEYLRKPIAQGWEAETQQDKRDQAITSIREALAEQPAQPCDMGEMCLDCQPRGPNGECPDKQPAQQEEPFAWGSGDGYWVLAEDRQARPDGSMYNIALYISPPASKPWVGQHPVVRWDSDGWGDLLVENLPDGTLLYTAQPASKPWVGLTDEDAQEVIEKSMQTITGGSNTFRVSANSVWTAIVRSVEAKLREKNA